MINNENLCIQSPLPSNSRNVNEQNLEAMKMDADSTSYIPKRQSEQASLRCSPSNEDISESIPSTRRSDTDDIIPSMNPFDLSGATPRVQTSSTFPSPQVAPDDAADGTNHSGVETVTSTCDASHLKSIDSPIVRNLMHSFHGNLGTHDCYDGITSGMSPLQRHANDGTTHSSVLSASTTKKEDETEQTSTTHCGTMPPQTTNDAYPNYRYRICSSICMDLIRRICRPHVTRPSFLHCLPPCHNKIKPHHQRILCRSIIILFMIVTITFTLLDLLILHQYLHVWLGGALDWLASNPFGGGLVFIGIILMASLCFFPVSLLALGAGFVYIDLYGLWIGLTAAFIVCYSGCLLGAAVCFARSRYLMRQLIQKFANRYPIVRAVDRALETMGFRLFLLLRLSPAMPFNALNYIGGITAVSFRDYWRATCIGILPGLLWTIFVGATFGTISARGVDGNQEFDRDSMRKGVVLGLGIALGILGLIATGIYAREELTKIVLAEQALEQSEISIVEEGVFIDQPHSSHEEQLTRKDDSSTSSYDLENTQPGASGENANEKHETFLDNTNETVQNNGFVEQGKDNSPHRHTPYRDTPWSPEAIALELPVVPHIFRRKAGSTELLDSLGNIKDKTAAEFHEQSDMYKTISAPEGDPMYGLKPFELHIDGIIHNEIPHKWVKDGNNRHHFLTGHTNRPRSNTDPISIHAQISPEDSIKLDEEAHDMIGKASIRRMHSMDDFDTLRNSVSTSEENSSPHSNRVKGFDREWFWIWD